jgi:hypothetical protein
MLYDGVNEWLRPLMGYADWPFGEIPGNVVGWAVRRADLIRDRQPNETIWVNSDHLSPTSTYPTGDETSAPRARSRFINASTINNTTGGPHLYRWPDSIGGINGRYDQYLWLTKKKNEGVVGACGSAEGGDWGFRWGQCAPGSGGSGTNAANTHATNGQINGVMLHEIGHAFGFYDWYGNAIPACRDRGVSRNPPGYGSTSRTIMHSTYHTGTTLNPTLNQYDQWQIRYYWSWIKGINTKVNLWNYTPVEWVENGGSTSVIAAHTQQPTQFRFDNRGTMRYNLGDAARTAELKIFDTRGRLVRTMQLSGTQTSVNTNLNIAPQMLIWRVEANGKVMDQGRTQFASR